MLKLQKVYPDVIAPKVRRRRATLLVLLFLLLVTPTVAQTQKPLTNDDVLQMVKEGFTEEVVIKAIEANKGDFDVSLPGLRTLKNAGVNEKIINAMLSASSRKTEAPTAVVASKGLPEEVGVYLKEREKLVEVQPEIVNWRTGGMLKAMATGGLSGGHINGTVKNPHSPLQTGVPLEFIIRCPEGTSVAEYQLLRLDEKNDRREFRAMTGGVMHASGGADKNAVPFLFEKIAPATFKVKLTDLKKGEYGFLPPGFSSASVAASGKVYTFGIE